MTLDPAMATASVKLSKTSQVQVIFRNVEETYPVGVDIQCTYSVNGSLEVGSRDWVGLYRVGWRSQSDYFYYDWSPLPPDYVKGKNFEGKIVFPGMSGSTILTITIVCIVNTVKQLCIKGTEVPLIRTTCTSSCIKANCYELVKLFIITRTHSS